MCVVTKESNPELYNALFEDENSKISIEIMNKRGQEIFDELKNALDKKDKEIDRLNNIINELEEDLDYEINDYKGDIDMEEKTLSGEFCRGIAWEADYLKNRIENLKEGK